MTELIIVNLPSKDRRLDCQDKSLIMKFVIYIYIYIFLILFVCKVHNIVAYFLYIVFKTKRKKIKKQF